MKRLSIFFLNGLLFSLVALSCKPKQSSGFSDQINKVVPKWAIDTVRKNGMVLYEGKTPPSFEGFFLHAPNHLMESNRPDDKIGDVYNSMTLGFYNQNNKSLTIDMKGKSEKGTYQFTGNGAFISGNGNYFTVFLEANGTTEENSSVATHKSFEIYSGELTPTGIQNLQSSLILVEKDDPGKILINIGDCRVFKDADGFSERTNGFRLTKQPSNDSRPSQLMAIQ
ncbi:hypothetical protein [Siphonobacter sp. SORGH_AS_1065]|uniref:hypothetical protein n=1 Tax=Siphonobacter sp. SORGH_AS_1065 TaxID=3041795 RepID=UPI00277E40F8|nr:hypothetical protein [Siphonobacter sp. SORGH_AS_1065]MDQ1089781.1 hypothetical protein [Siphonobacter sp. SORGH_AS_1065]